MSRQQRGTSRDDRKKAALREANAQPLLSRRAWLGVALGGGATALAGAVWWRRGSLGATEAVTTVITVYASPSCGCCHKWVEHLEKNGFAVTVENRNDVTPVKNELGVPRDLWSCHTGVVDGYAIEGHVPADLIRKVLRERPSITGLSAPGMPNGSPGMEGPTKDRYEIIAFGRDGKREVYAVR